MRVDLSENVEDDLCGRIDRGERVEFCGEEAAPESRKHNFNRK